MDQIRVEHDLLGEIMLSSKDLFGIHTARASENFRLGGESLRQFPALLTALALVKSAAAWTNVKLGVLPAEIGHAVMTAAREVAGGGLHEHFPLELVQGGGGTSTNMNMNEVLASRATALLEGAVRVDPHDHVNRSQSTNDVMPTALNLAVLTTARETVRSLRGLAESLERKAGQYRSLERLGRTCLQDAVPVPAALVHQGQAASVLSAARVLESAAGELRRMPLGATAIGTGLGAPPGYRELALRRLAEETELDLEPVANLSEGISSLEGLASVADAMARAGRVLARIASDLRILASGPIGGFGEVRLPPVQAGSSIMPGKVNPVIPELVMQVSFQLEGGAHIVHLACSAGELEVTPMGPVVTAELLRGLRRLDLVAGLFATRCVDGLTWNEEAVRANLRGSLQEAVESAVEHGHTYAVNHFPLEPAEGRT
ncbi:lyase family protein [Nonomuraea dietziae]|uniref:Aspartate ammonia-lyase n=1 Tax=Nonomuraea dietziae TaxID=65515 RepID=A0A7W5V4D8_9ACTN|nr:lyase family protein [Nonomuraea dietziae]MBB3725359.1 aspartate ammonia-lyase [Nonomuraea dietziae]